LIFQGGGPVRDKITTSLDTLGLLVLATGGGMAVAGWAGLGAEMVATGVGAAAAGLLVVGGSVLMVWTGGRR
jgi:hypothetical protein